MHERRMDAALAYRLDLLMAELTAARFQLISPQNIGNYSWLIQAAERGGKCAV